MKLCLIVIVTRLTGQDIIDEAQTGKSYIVSVSFRASRDLTHFAFCPIVQ